MRVWAQALAERDGLARYKMMTGDMQRQFVENQKEYIGDENWNFVIGYSSPQTVGFDIVSLRKADIYGRKKQPPGQQL